MERIADIETYLSAKLSKRLIDELVDSVGLFPEDFPRLFGLIGSADIKVSWRSAWTCKKLSILHPEWFVPLREQLIQLLIHCQHPGTTREILSILYHIPQTVPISVALLNYCIAHMLPPEEEIAVQALCLKLGYELCLVEPELLEEFSAYLDHMDIGYYSTGVQAVIRTLKNKINRKNRKCFQKK